MSKVKIMVDDAIEHYNQNNPDKRKMTRETLGESVGVTTTTIQNWKSGKVPKAFEAIAKIMEETGVKDLTKLIKIE